MATTRLMSLHVGKGQTAGDAIKRALGYVRVDEDIEIETSDFSALSGLIEVQSIHPEHLPSGWICEEYSYTRIDSTIYYAESYLNEQDRIEYRCTVFQDADSVIGGKEQDGTGQKLHIGSNKVYTTENINTKTATWSIGLTDYSLYGNYTLEELRNFVESIE